LKARWKFGKLWFFKFQMKQSDLTHKTVEHLFRHESGKMLSVLVKLFGLKQVGIAEDIVQDTLVSAFDTWKIKGMPENPRAWLYRVAKNKTIDYLRRERNFQDRVAPNISSEILQNAVSGQFLDSLFLDHEIEDAQLRMMFACCHPSIPSEAQLILILRTLCGLSAKEIAVAFLEPEDTIAKRLYRAKEKIRQENLQMDVPLGNDLLPRLDAVLQAIYILFNEGYKSASTASVIRRELCEEALRLGDLMIGNPIVNLPRTYALQALMCFQSSRFDARMDKNGDIILLEHQDRKQWNYTFITLGYTFLQQSSLGNEVTDYHLEAAIASYHASAPTFEQTNWKAIFYCYDLLWQISPSPFVAMNRAIALGYSDGPQKGIDALLKIVGLEKSHLYHSAMGDFFLKNRAYTAALQSYQTALLMAKLPTEQRVIASKIEYISHQNK
jgi:RNA polymerase sigma factor (sigma-70 family)